MPIDVHNFVVPEQDFEGLDRLTNNVQRRTAMQQRAAQDAEAKKAASTKFFANYLDDKEKFTGTRYDPYQHAFIGTALNQAMDLVKEGANDSDILAAINPLVNKAAVYTQNAQQYALNKKQALEQIKGIKGIDPMKFSEAYDNMAWGGKDPTQVDPNANYADQVLQNADVYNAEGFQEHFKNAKRNTTVENIQRTNSKGGTTRNQEEISGETYLVPDYDAKGDFVGMVPKYQTLQDDGKQLIGKFHTDKGIVDAPIRALDDGEFNRLPTSAKAFALQEARKYAKEKNIPLSDSRVEFLAKSIAYDELKPLQSVTHKTIEQQKANPAPRITVNVAGSKADQRAALTKNDLYTALDETPVDQNGEIEITPLTGGISYLKNSRGKQISQPSLKFNPTTKMVTYTDPATSQEETVSLSKFKSMAKSNNTKEDLDYLEFLRNYNRNSDKKIDTDAPAKNAIQKTVDKVMNMFPTFGGSKSETKAPEANADDVKFQEWKSKLPKNLQNDKDYDLKGLWKSNPNQTPSGNLHFPDKYKKPNHITFSNESIYSKGVDAGRWGTENGKDVFYAAPINIQNAGSESKLKEYFSKNEPNVKLVLPKSKWDKYKTN